LVLRESREKMMKTYLRYLAVLLFVVAIISTALGGWANMTGRPIIITDQHAWNDGLFMIMVAIFLLIFSTII
jgi:Na+/H+ antiporter NhaB